MVVLFINYWTHFQVQAVIGDLCRNVIFYEVYICNVWCHHKTFYNLLQFSPLTNVLSQLKNDHYIKYHDCTRSLFFALKIIRFDKHYGPPCSQNSVYSRPQQLHDSSLSVSGKVRVSWYPANTLYCTRNGRGQDTNAAPFVDPDSSPHSEPWDSQTDIQNGGKQQQGLVERTSLTEWELSGNTGSAAATETTRLFFLQPTGTHSILHYSVCYIFTFL